MAEASGVELTPIATVAVHVPDGLEFKDAPDGAGDKRACCDIRESGFFKVDVSLLKYKSFYFWFLGAIGAVFPYFSVYFKQLGFSPNQIGIISGVRPLVGFCSGPLWGSLADRFRIRRIMLMISALGWLAFITGIGFVPPAKYDPDCAFVGVLKGNITKEAYSGPTPELRPDATADETLQEDRGWMFDEIDLNRVFITVIILVILGEVVMSPTGALADSGCVEELGSYDMHKYGHQRAWGSLSLAIL